MDLPMNKKKLHVYIVYPSAIRDKRHVRQQTAHSYNNDDNLNDDTIQGAFLCALVIHAVAPHVVRCS